MCSGAGLVASGVGRVSNMCVSGRLLVEVALPVDAFIRLAWSLSCVGEGLSGVKNFSHEACMVVSRGVVSFGSYLSSIFAGRSKVDLSVSREVRREVLGPDLSLFGSLTMITLVGWICSV
jgi:hypothetical protein